MKQAMFSISFVLVAFLTFAQNAGIKEVNPAQFEQLIKKPRGVLLDVRTKSEFKNGHISDSGQLNFYSFSFRKNLLLLPKNEPIYLYCNTGWRSEKAAKILVENGYKNVYNLEHGIMDWELQNLPVVVDPDAKPDTENKMGYEELTRYIESGKPVFIDFYAPWCGPCRQMMPMMDSLKTEYHGKINIVKVNVDASKKLVKEMKIQSVPYLALYEKGELLYSKNGAVNRKEIIDIFQSNISK